MKQTRLRKFDAGSERPALPSQAELYELDEILRDEAAEAYARLICRSE